MSEISDYDRHLAELVHFLTKGGLNIRDINRFLTTPSKDHKNMTPLECIRKSGGLFLNDLKTFVNQNENA